MAIADLIYDVGMHNGDDSAFYLHRNFRVVAVEADPDLVAAAQRRFEKEIAERRLTILNVGIAETDGWAEFWRCETNSEWNSFDRTAASRHGSEHASIQIPTRRFATILEEFGVPFYLKIDIEGRDHLCIRDLATVPRSSLPAYVSWENDLDGTSSSLNEERSSGLELSRAVGYSRFKLIEQATFSAISRGVSPANLLDSAAWYAMRVGNGRLQSRTRPLWRSLTHRGRLERKFGWSFPMGSTGPWGDDMPGQWMSLAEAKLAMADAPNRFPRSPHLSYSLAWCDWHARL